MKLPMVGMGVVIAVAVAFLPATAQAYIGPGAGISAIGSAVALVGAVLFSILGFIWYPVKRLVRFLRGGRKGGPDEGGANEGGANEGGANEGGADGA